MKLFDSHTHLNDEPFADDIAGYNMNAKELDVIKIANVGSDYNLNDKALKLATDYPNMYAIIGWHPESADQYDDKAEQYLLDNLNNEKAVAIGEIGLDYHWEDAPSRDIQKKTFIAQLKLANKLGVPVSIHCRDAYEDAYEIFCQIDLSNTKVIMHSFNGDVKWLHKFLELGFYISYSGVVSFKNAKEVHESAAITPLDKMLLETDAPYLTPVPYRGAQNQPAYTRYVLEAIAKLRDEPIDEIANQTYKNTCEIFNING
ncbi:TatD family hydrolase [Companilactobacillus sp. RD055328]|uniref:TatD family hydrolase n=1 Tax=Companilactobacillus sp. RD055328 TaxID=2916634 RepID=UPI001FC82569|nr:TatD family hydrolase [Companilactobacillus sp. RD055328]GKQ42323.1 TatD family hydrolase [Companilactobacillus sp. RD055328]